METTYYRNCPDFLPWLMEEHPRRPLQSHPGLSVKDFPSSKEDLDDLSL